MIIDFNDTALPAHLEADYCIVGSGVVGLAISLELQKTGKQILLLESGDMEQNGSYQSLYDADITGQPFSGHLEGRFRMFGGSSNRWGGQALPLPEIIFEERDWIQHSGWPIQHSDIEPFYPMAERYLGLAPLPFETDYFAKFKLPNLNLDEQVLQYHFSKWSPRPNLGREYLNQLTASPNVRVVLHANVTNLELAKDLKTVCRASLRSLEGKNGEASAKRFILCCGGIENARLLLLSNKQLPEGIGNQRDLVGRFFQDHPTVQIATLKPLEKDRVQAYFNARFLNTTRLLPRLSLSDKYQKKHRLLSASSTIQFIVPSENAAEQLRSIFRKISRRQFDTSLFAHAWKAALQLPAAAATAADYLLSQRVYLPGSEYRLAVIMEQEPDPESRIYLSEKLDALRQAKTAINWKPSDLTLRTLKHFSRAAKEELEKTGLCKVELDDWLNEPQDTWRKQLGDAFHHIGTTRMAASDSEGVVDTNCKVFGTENLYIAGSSVFPSGGHSNPSLAAIALGFRLAEHLKN